MMLDMMDRSFSDQYIMLYTRSTMQFCGYLADVQAVSGVREDDNRVNSLARMAQIAMYDRGRGNSGSPQPDCSTLCHSLHLVGLPSQ